MTSRRAAAGDLLLAAVLALAWVRFYGYRYDVAFLNSPVVNWWAFTIWIVCLYVMLRLRRGRLRRGWSEPRAILFVWGVSLVITLALEYVGQEVLGIHEARGYPPLVLGFVHGTVVMKLVYVFVAPVLLSGVALAKKLGGPPVRMCSRPPSGSCGSSTTR